MAVLIQMTKKEYLSFQKMLRAKNLKADFGPETTEFILDLMRRVDKLEKTIKGMETRINNLNGILLNLDISNKSQDWTSNK
mgnify:CR=1 FL=1